MILKHYTIKCPNNIKDIIKELEKIDSNMQNFFVNEAYVNKEHFIILQIDEKKSNELIELT